MSRTEPLAPSAASSAADETHAADSGDTGDIAQRQVAIPISPQNPISPLQPAAGKRAFGVQKQVETLRRTRVILSGRAWEWWWWENESGSDGVRPQRRRRTRYGGMFHKLSRERKEQYEHNRKLYWDRKIASAARREANELG